MFRHDTAVMAIALGTCVAIAGAQSSKPATRSNSPSTASAPATAATKAAVPYVYQMPDKAPADAKPGTLTGAAWITKADDTSEPWRGIEIRATKGVLISGESTAKKFTKMREQNVASIAELQKSSKDLSTSAAQGGVDDRSREEAKLVAKLGTATVGLLQANNNAIDEVLKNMPEQITINQAVAMTRRCGHYGVPMFADTFFESPAISKPPVVAAHTDIDGKYKLTGLTPGKWVIYAWSGNKSDWCIEVEIKSGDNSLDLFSKNMSTGVRVPK